MSEVRPSRRQGPLEQMGPKIVRGIPQEHFEEPLSGKPSSRRKGTQGGSEADDPYLAQAMRQLGVLTPKPELRVEASRGLKGPLGHDRVAAQHHRAASRQKPTQQVDEIYASIKSSCYEPRRFTEIIGSDRTAQGDEVWVP